jgi:hypothetical protein
MIEMTNLLIDALIVFWLLLFGGLALLPMLTGATSVKQSRPRPVVEDRVLSIRPARPSGSGAPALRAPATPSHAHHDRTAA